MRFSQRESSHLLDDNFHEEEKFPNTFITIARLCVPICFITFCSILIAIFGFLVFLTVTNYLELEKDQQIIVDGHKRYYILHFPKNYNKTEKLPLVIALHGGFGNARQFKRTSGWDQISDENNFIVLYPHGYSKSGRLILLAWNSGTILSEAYQSNVSDVNFIKTLTEKIISDYNIDPEQVFCSGHSNGAMMCYRMAGDAPSLFKAIVPVSGTCGGYINREYPKYIIPTPTNPVKLVHVHGLKDVNVKYEGGLGEGPGSRGRIDLGINETLKVFTSSNHCEMDFESEFSQNRLIELKNYKCQDNQRNIQLYLIHNRAHMWNDMGVDVAREKFKGKNLVDAIWNLMMKK